MKGMPHFSASLPLSVLLCSALAFSGCSGGGGSDSVSATAQPASQSPLTFEPPEVTNGERLFLETRFAQFFKAYLDAGGRVNTPMPAGDPVMTLTDTTVPGQGLPGPFAGLSMNCRACHLVDEHVGTPGGGMRNIRAPYGIAMTGTIPIPSETMHTNVNAGAFTRQRAA